MKTPEEIAAGVPRMRTPEEWYAEFYWRVFRAVPLGSPKDIFAGVIQEVIAEATAPLHAIIKGQADRICQQSELLAINAARAPRYGKLCGMQNHHDTCECDGSGGSR